MDYENKYKEAIERAKKWRNAPNVDKIPTYANRIIEEIFPELKESEDERIRKEMIEILTKEAHDFPSSVIAEKSNSWIAWLEKQGSEPNWCHHKVDLSNCSEEYRKAYYDGWNNCNMQHSQCKSESNDVVKCLINGMKFYYEDNTEATWGTEKFSMKVKDILAWLEKQGQVKYSTISQHEDIMSKENDNSLICEDERIRKWLIYYFKEVCDNVSEKEKKGVLTWLEKQGEQKPDSGGFWEGYNTAKEKFKQELADKVEPIERSGKINSRNAKGVLKEMLDKKLKSDDKVEPKFKVGDFLVNDYCMGKVVELTNDAYLLDTGQGIPFSCEHNAHIWTIEDAKPGDVLADDYGIYIFEKFDECDKNCYVCIGAYQYSQKVYKCEHMICSCSTDTHPATKEQRNTLMKAIADAGYTFDFEKKELTKIEQKPWSEEDKVKDNWELIHEFVNKFGRIPKDEDELNVLIEYVLKRQKHVWSEEDEKKRNLLINILNVNHPNEYFKVNPANTLNMGAMHTKELVDWLKFLKNRVFSQSKQEWKQENTSDLTDFENAMMHIGGSFFGENAGLDPNDTNAIKEQANILLGLVQKQEWSKEDEIKIKSIIVFLKSPALCCMENNKGIIDENIKYLKSLKDRYTWKPSDKHYELEEFAKIVRSNLTGISRAVIERLKAKYLQLTGNKMGRNSYD